MATKIAKKNEPAAGLTLTQSDELAALGLEGDIVDDGLDEIDAGDVRIQSYVWNFKGKDANGRAVPIDVFYSTVDETTRESLDLAFVSLAKSNEWREYVEGEGSRIRCRSWDRNKGVMEDGTVRPCAGCPDAQWKTDDNGKRFRRCGVVFNVLAVDRETAQPAFLRFKKTSLPVIQQHLNRHHLGKRVVAGKRGNYPLFSFQVKARLEVSENGNYSLPVLERGPVLSREEVLAHQETARAFRDTYLPMLRDIAEKQREDGDEVDTSFNPDDFADEAKTAAADGKRF